MILLPLGGNFDFGPDREQAFRAMADRDPDGQDYGQHGPTHADYERFAVWAVQRYGRALWDEYNAPRDSGDGARQDNDGGTFNDRP